MIRISKKTRKCSVCGKCAEGWLLKSERLENLPAVFLCVSCLSLLNESERAQKKPRAEKVCAETGKRAAAAAKKALHVDERKEETV